MAGWRWPACVEFSTVLVATRLQLREGGGGAEAGCVCVQMVSGCCSSPSGPAANPCATCFKSSIGFSRNSHGRGLGAVKASVAASARARGVGWVPGLRWPSPVSPTGRRGAAAVPEDPPHLVSRWKALWRCTCSATGSPTEPCVG